MEIIKKKIDELHESDYNPRISIKQNKIEYDLLFNSIKEFGYIEPIIFNKTTKNIVGGNQRLQVLKDLGHTEVDCVEVAMSLKEEKILNITLNKIKGTWDEAKLKDLIDGLNENMQKFTGFSDKEIAKLLEQTEPSMDIPKETELNVFDFEDESFDCQCPYCNFKFNKK